MNQELREYFQDRPMLLTLYRACVVASGVEMLFGMTEKRILEIAKGVTKNGNVRMVDIGYLLRGMREIANTGLPIDEKLRDRAQNLAEIIEITWASDLEEDKKVRSLIEAERWKREKEYRTAAAKVRRKKKKQGGSIW